MNHKQQKIVEQFYEQKKEIDEIIAELKSQERLLFRLMLRQIQEHEIYSNPHQNHQRSKHTRPLDQQLSQKKISTETPTVLSIAA